MVEKLGLTERVLSMRSVGHTWGVIGEVIGVPIQPHKLSDPWPAVQAARDRALRADYARLEARSAKI